MPPFHRPRRIELEFKRALDALMREWLKRPPGENLDDLFQFLNTEGSSRVTSAAERIAKGMVTATARENAISWRHAAMKSTRSRQIHDLLAREMDGPVGSLFDSLVKQHSILIRSIPRDIAHDIASQIATRQMRGVRAETIAKDISKRIPKIAQSKIALIARTEVSSTATALSEARAEHLGLPAYEWLTAEDIRVRMSHVKMDHVIVFWADPPSPEALIGKKSKLGRYHAGQCPNCRCDANVIVSLDQFKWPMKVYTEGRIQRMSRAKFSQIYR